MDFEEKDLLFDGAGCKNIRFKELTPCKENISWPVYVKSVEKDRQPATMSAMPIIKRDGAGCQIYKRLGLPLLAVTQNGCGFAPAVCVPAQ
jgi:hypothetical protein